MGAAGGAALATVLALGLGACGRPAAVAPAARGAGDGGFLPPPTLTAAGWTTGGGVRLAGLAPPDAVVRLQSPDGRALGVTADAAGAWSAETPPAAEPRLFALSAEVAGRTVRAEGALTVAPPGASAAALVARAGAASVPAGPDAATPAPSLQVVDFDGGGGIAVAGRAAPGATLKFSADGVGVGAGRADAAGRFGLPGVGPALPRGPHRLRVESPAGVAEAAVDTAAGEPLAGPYRVARAPGGWRVDWSTPGGGAQSLLLLDAPAGARP